MWELIDAGDGERAIAQIEELAPEEQQAILRAHGTREALIDYGQEEAI